MEQRPLDAEIERARLRSQGIDPDFLLEKERVRQMNRAHDLARNALRAEIRNARFNELSAGTSVSSVLDGRSEALCLDFIKRITAIGHGRFVEIHSGLAGIHAFAEDPLRKSGFKLTKSKKRAINELTRLDYHPSRLGYPVFIRPKHRFDLGNSEDIFLCGDGRLRTKAGGELGEGGPLMVGYVESRRASYTVKDGYYGDTLATAGKYIDTSKTYYHTAYDFHEVPLAEHLVGLLRAQGAMHT